WGRRPKVFRLRRRNKRLLRLWILRRRRPIALIRLIINIMLLPRIRHFAENENNEDTVACFSDALYGRFGIVKACMEKPRANSQNFNRRYLVRGIFLAGSQKVQLLDPAYRANHM